MISNPLLILVVLLLCLNHVNGQIGQTCFSGAARQAFLSSLSSILQPNYLIQEGEFTLINITDCMELPSCQFQNANSPYGSFTFPPHPYGEESNPKYGNGTEPIFPENWQMDTTDAILILFCTPPPSSYFGLTPYIVDKYIDGETLDVFGSLGDTLNGVFMKYFDNLLNPTNRREYSNAFVTFSGDRNVYEEVTTALNKLGLDAGLNNELQAPFGYEEFGLQYGLEPTSDLYQILFREAVPVNQTEWEEYAKILPFSTLRIVRNRSLPQPPANLYPAPTLRNRELPYDELYLKEAVDALVGIVEAEFSTNYLLRHSWFSFSALGARGIDWGYDCYIRDSRCVGDNRDSQYAGLFPNFAWNSDPEFFAIFIGVNHNATGMAAYSNVVIYDLGKQVGVASISNQRYQGSADRFLAGTAYETFSSYLHVTFWKRVCGGEPFCVEIPATGFPSLGDGVQSYFMTRAYVSPAGVGPDFDDLTRPHYFLATPRR